MIIAVIGGSECTKEVSELAEAVGREIAKRGATLVCGGLGGVMEAACRGAKLAGGVTVGILPGEDARQANEYVEIPVVTGMGWARNVIVVKSAQAVIAIDGQYGTLSEIAYALGYGLPVIDLNTWALSRGGQPINSLIPARDPVDAVEKAVALAKQSERLHLTSDHT